MKNVYSNGKIHCLVSDTCLFQFLSFQIQWDEPATIQRPERVSPWEIEPFVASTSMNLAQPVVKSKRPRPVDIPPSGMRNYLLDFLLYVNVYT